MEKKESENIETQHKECSEETPQVLNQQIIILHKQKFDLKDNRVVRAILETKLEELDLSNRSYNYLKRNINSVYDIVYLNIIEDIRDFDAISIIEIKHILIELGINLDNKEQCKDLITRYNIGKSINIVRSMETNQRKKDALYEMKKKLESNSKENNNNHGTK